MSRKNKQTSDNAPEPDPATDPATRPATDPATRPATDPATRPATPHDPKVAALLASEQLYERAMKHADTEELRHALEQLSPDEAAMFVILVEKQLRKRRLELLGYALGLAVFLGGMVFALYQYATREPGEFMGWTFLIPFLLVGAVLLIFGRLSRRS